MKLRGKRPKKKGGTQMNEIISPSPCPRCGSTPEMRKRHLPFSLDPEIFNYFFICPECGFRTVPGSMGRDPRGILHTAEDAQKNALANWNERREQIIPERLRERERI